MGMVQEFKKFAIRGNVIDMAVGIVIGAAFGKIVSSFVADVIMPPLGLMLGDVDFSNLLWVLKPATETAEAVTVNYGVFIMTIIDFFIIALAIFMVIKGINEMKRKEEETPKEEPKPSQEIVLLTEIRDELKKS